MLSQVLMSVETTLLLSVAALYIVHCPFNKVEESFNTQAVHDVINLFPDRLPHHDQINDQGQLIDSARREVASRQQLPWDHILFPGVVPRTFVGALIVGLPLKVASYLMPESDEPENEPDFTSQLLMQIGSRFALSAFLALSMSAVSRAVHKRFGLSFRICFILTTISQFHYMFYAGRFLPNTSAAILANLVFASWINRQYSKSIIYIAFCVIIFRFDTAIFFGVLLFDAVFIKRYIPLSRVLFLGLPAGLMAILVTFSIDSIFWARPLWPELEGVYFNVWLNQSHLWGVQPYFWYIYNCIPRILMAWAPLILLAEHRITRDYFIPILAFILVYSFLPHKELRFILFVTPFLNICVTSGLMNLQFYLNKLFSLSTWKRNRSKGHIRSQDDSGRSYIGTFVFILILACIFITNLFGCFVLSRISSHNYPGGQAGVNLGMTRELLEKAQQSLAKSRDGELRDPRSNVAVYVTNLAAQSGLSRFIQVDGVYYAKTPNLDSNTFSKAYDLIYLIFEPNEVVTFLHEYCPQKAKPGKEFYNELLRKGLETKCNLPNQTQMFCSIISTTKSFKSINMSGLIRKFKQINSIERVADSLNDSGFIETYDALNVIRCSTKSKHNPFS